MDENTFYRQIAHHILAETYVWRKSIYWPYVNLKLGGRAIYGLDQKFQEVGYDFPHGVTAVYWQNGCISYKFMPAGYTAISYDFMGCYMAKIRIDGFWYIFHIHSSSGTNSDCKAIWKNFKLKYKKRITELYEFRPIKPYDNYYIVLLKNKINK